MIEAELKARLSNPDTVREALRQRAVGESSTYRDTYYDTPDGRLERDGQELRIRSIHSPDIVRHVLTFKGAAVDQASQSKPEHETTVASRGVTAQIVEGLGFVPATHLTKECENFRFSVDGRDYLATVVRVAELDGIFLEVETMAEPHELDAALASVRVVMEGLGVTGDEITTEKYTDAVRAARAR